MLFLCSIEDKRLAIGRSANRLSLSITRALEQARLWREGHDGVEREDRAAAARVAETTQIGAGCAGCVDVDHACSPLSVKVVLAVWRLDHHRVEVLRVLAVCQEQRAVEQVHRPAGDDQRDGAGVEHGGRPSIPFTAPRFIAEPPFGQQVNARRNRQGSEAAWVERATYGDAYHLAHAGRKGRLYGRRIDDWDQRGAAVAGIEQRAKNRI